MAAASRAGEVQPRTRAETARPSPVTGDVVVLITPLGSPSILPLHPYNYWEKSAHGSDARWFWLRPPWSISHQHRQVGQKAFLAATFGGV